MDNSLSSEVRCVTCNKLLAKNKGDSFEIKCHRCGSLNRVFEQMTEQVVILDPKGKILFINNALEKITGYSVSESIGKTPSELWGGNMKKEFYADMWKKMKSKKGSIKLKLTNKKKSGELYNLDLVISPIISPKGDILLFVGIEAVV